MRSYVLASLNSTSEAIGSNFSSNQLLSLLDTLWWRAIRSVTECSNYVDYALIDICSGYSQSQRRKLNRWSKERLYAYTMIWPLADVSTKARMWKKMRLERTVPNLLMASWLAEAIPLLPIHIKIMKGEKVLDSDRSEYEYKMKYVLHITDSKDFLACVTKARSWTEQALEHRKHILQKYHRHVSVQTINYTKTSEKRSGSRLSKNDVAQSFLVAVTKAIDKCDTHLGTLTSYVDKWLLDAKTSNKYRVEIGTAFDTNQAQRRKLAESPNSLTSNYTVSIDSGSLDNHLSDTNVEQEIDRNQTIDMVRKLAGLADPTGLGLIKLDLIPYVEKSQLLKRRLVQ